MEQGGGGLHQSLTATMFLRNIFIRMMSCLVAALCGICLRKWYLNAKLSGIHLCKSCKKSPHKSSPYFANIPSDSRDCYEN